MWYAYLKAAWRGLTTALFSRWVSSMTFKATSKGTSPSDPVQQPACNLTADQCLPPKPNRLVATGKSRLEASAFRDIWIHYLTAIILSATIACGVWQVLFPPCHFRTTVVA